MLLALKKAPAKTSFLYYGICVKNFPMVFVFIYTKCVLLNAWDHHDNHYDKRSAKNANLVIFGIFIVDILKLFLTKVLSKQLPFLNFFQVSTMLQTSTFCESLTVKWLPNSLWIIPEICKKKIDIWDTFVASI